MYPIPQSLSKEELQAEVDKLFEEDAADKEEPAAVEEAPVANEEPPLTRINPVIPPQAKERQPEEAPEEEAEPTKAIEVEQPQAPAEETAFVNEERLMEETAQIRMQMDDYEGELNDLHDKSIQVQPDPQCDPAGPDHRPDRSHRRDHLLAAAGRRPLLMRPDHRKECLYEKDQYSDRRSQCCRKEHDRKAIGQTAELFPSGYGSDVSLCCVSGAASGGRCRR